jgi:hypothetical protein
MWGFAYDDDDGQLYWCTEDKVNKNASNGQKIPVPVIATKEQLAEPFLLVSQASKDPNLRAVNLDNFTDHKIPFIYCLHFKADLEQTKIKQLEFSSDKSSKTSEISNFEEEVNQFIN